jgi:hypothetical protein
LKKSEQKIYTLARMASAEELLGTFVFSEHHEFVVPIIQLISDPPEATASAGESVPEKGALRDEEQGVGKQSASKQSVSTAPTDGASAEDLELDVSSRRPAVGQAHVLSMDAEDEQERTENAAEDIHALVDRLHKRNHILSQFSCVCCEEERHVGNQASARPDLQPIV